MSIVCLGEALVDLIAVGEEEEAEPFEMHFGGALANAAVAIARAGVAVELAGGCGPDRFGSFLRKRLAAEGVGLEHHHVLEHLQTPFALVHLGGDGEPEFAIHGDGIEAAMAGLDGDERELVAGADALVLGSNTLVDEPGLGVTMRTVDAADDRGAPILFDPNLRPGRWDDLELGLDRCRPIVAASALTKANIAEARLLCEEPGLDAARGAEALVSLGAELAVVTDGPRGAVARGVGSASVPGVPVSEPRPLGAGDAFMGTLVARLVPAGFEAGALASALEAAGAAAAAACGRTGAIA